MSFESYEHLLFERRDNGVLVITMNRPHVGNAANAVLHREIGEVWRDVGRDTDTRVAVLTGAGESFSVGGEVTEVEAGRDPAAIARSLLEMRQIVYSMIELDKPIISAINGAAVASGLAVGLLADISIIGENVRVTDGHARAGLVAGDHAVLLWPLLTSMAKAKYYLITGDSIDGREAERIGLVTFCVADDDVLPRALSIADRLGRGPQLAQQWTKRTLNHWLRQAAPAFEHSGALEILSLFTPDVAAATEAMRNGQRPIFPSAT